MCCLSNAARKCAKIYVACDFGDDLFATCWPCSMRDSTRHLAKPPMQCDAMRVCLASGSESQSPSGAQPEPKSKPKSEPKSEPNSEESGWVQAPAEFQLNAHKLKISNNSGTRTPNKTMPNTQSHKKGGAHWKKVWSNVWLNHNKQVVISQDHKNLWDMVKIFQAIEYFKGYYKVFY